MIAYGIGKWLWIRQNKVTISTDYKKTDVIKETHFYISLMRVLKLYPILNDSMMFELDLLLPLILVRVAYQLCATLMPFNSLNHWHPWGWWKLRSVPKPRNLFSFLKDLTVSLSTITKETRFYLLWKINFSREIWLRRVTIFGEDVRTGISGSFVQYEVLRFGNNR